MNSLWPATPRISCLNTRTIFRTCQQSESLAGRIAHGFSRAYCKDSRSSPQHGLIHNSEGKRSKAIWRGSPVANTLVPSFRTYASRPQRVITRYEDLPKNFSDEQGLPFRTTPLSKEEVVKIFGTYVDVEDANHTLRRIHGRRVAGTMGDPSLPYGLDGAFTRKGLAWLRKNVPVDEVEYAGRRAEMELEAMEADIVADAERIGLYKSTPKGKNAKAKKQYAPNSSGNKDVYGKSGLDKIREDNLKRLDAIDAAAKAKREQQALEIGLVGPNSGTLSALSTRANVRLTRHEEDPRAKYHKERARTALPEEPPEMSVYQRLMPSALMTVAVILGSLLLVETYTPPSRETRLFPDIPPSVATITGILLINLVAFMAWRILPAQRFMLRNMIYHPGFPRVAAVIGSVFSHQTVSHLVSNMLVLGLIGTYLHEEIGRAPFVAVFMSAGAVGSFSSLLYWTWRGSFISSSLGASGAICGIVACYLMNHSDREMRLFGTFPPEGWKSISCMTGLILLIAIDVFGARKGKFTIDHLNHLGGYATGVVAAWLIGRRSRRKQAAAKASGKEMGLIDGVKEGKISG